MEKQSLSFALFNDYWTYEEIDFNKLSSLFKEDLHSIWICFETKGEKSVLPYETYIARYSTKMENVQVFKILGIKTKKSSENTSYNLKSMFPFTWFFKQNIYCVVCEKLIRQETYFWSSPKYVCDSCQK